MQKEVEGREGDEEEKGRKRFEDCLKTGKRGEGGRDVDEDWRNLRKRAEGALKSREEAEKYGE